jgi:hypothetical protein
MRLKRTYSDHNITVHHDLQSANVLMSTHILNKRMSALQYQDS